MACTAALGLATMAGIWAAGLLLPVEHRTLGIRLCIGLAVAYPLVLAAQGDADAPIQITRFAYAAASWAAGMFAAAQLMPAAPRPAQAAMRLHPPMAPAALATGFAALLIGASAIVRGPS